MSAGLIEPRTAMWARAEISWQDPGGAPIVSAAIIEDTSSSGACLRVKKPVSVGAKLTIKWRKEHFCAIARNCRRDGTDFLLGVQRDTSGSAVSPAPLARERDREEQEYPAAASAAQQSRSDEPALAVTGAAVTEPAPTTQRTRHSSSKSNSRMRSETVRSSATAVPTQANSSGHERTVMESKSMFPKFWRREQGGDSAPESRASAQAPASQPETSTFERVAGPKADSLSYEDIYRAAGILRPSSGYDIGKVVEMLHSERIRGLSDDIKRASVLMAIETAGASPDELLRDATERQQALEAYENGQRKQLEQFEARKAHENVQIEAEMARVTQHYTERIKANLDQVACEREALRNWQMAKQHESQRNSEVIDLCTKPAEPQTAMAAGARNSQARTSSGPSLIAGVATGRPN